MFIAVLPSTVLVLLLLLFYFQRICHERICEKPLNIMLNIMVNPVFAGIIGEVGGGAGHRRRRFCLPAREARIRQGTGTIK